MYKKYVIFLLLAVFLLTGCWDKIEIEERAHISALGIDKYTPPPDEEREQTSEDAMKNKFAFTFAFPKDSLEEVEDIVIKTVGETFFSAGRILANRTNKQAFLGHLRTVILGVDTTKNPELFREVLDGIETNELISRRVVLTITEDKASDIIDIDPTMHPRIGEFISEIFRRRDRTAIVPQGDIGSILKDLHETGNTVISKIIPGETDVKVVGLGVISNYQFKGWLSETESASLNILKGEANEAGGLVTEYRGHSIPIDLRFQKPKLTLVESEDNIQIRIEVDAEAEIKQTYFEANEDLLNPEVIKEIEDSFTNDAEELMRKTINKLQKEFETDVLGIDIYLRQRHYRLWKEIEGDWQDIFPTIDIRPSMNVKIRRVGLVR